jgi:predicted nucleic acid-binding protein
MERVLVDLNVVLDVLLNRSPHADAAAELWAEIENGAVQGLLPAHSVTTLHYLATKSGGRAFGDRCLTNVLSVFSVASVDGSVLEQALAMRWTDFEDAVCAAAAVAASCQVIVTRDPRGFRKASLPAMSPSEAVAAIRSA